MPFVFAYGYELIKHPAFITAIKTSAALWLLFVSAYPSFFICAAYVLLAALIAVVIKKLIYKGHKNLSSLFTFLVLSVLVFMILSAPAIFSYWEILPFYHRGEGVSLKDAGYNPFSLSCTWSYILPGAPLKILALRKRTLFPGTGILTWFFCCSFSALPGPGKACCVILLQEACFSFFFLGSLTPVRVWSYQLLPLMDTFRHPANARLL